MYTRILSTCSYIYILCGGSPSGRLVWARTCHSYLCTNQWGTRLRGRSTIVVHPKRSEASHLRSYTPHRNIDCGKTQNCTPMNHYMAQVYKHLFLPNKNGLADIFGSGASSFRKHFSGICATFCRGARLWARRYNSCSGPDSVLQLSPVPRRSMRSRVAV